MYRYRASQPKIAILRRCGSRDRAVSAVIALTNAPRRA
jgi:hypothetical protein